MCGVRGCWPCMRTDLSGLRGGGEGNTAYPLLPLSPRGPQPPPPTPSPSPSLISMPQLWGVKHLNVLGVVNELYLSPPITELLRHLCKIKSGFHCPTCRGKLHWISRGGNPHFLWQPLPAHSMGCHGAQTSLLATGKLTQGKKKHMQDLSLW